MSATARVWLGTALAILCGVLIIPYATILPYYSITRADNPSLSSDLITWFITTFLLAAGCFYGINLRRKAKLELEPTSEGLAMDTKLLFISSITLAEYRYILVAMTIGIPGLIFWVLFGILSVIGSIIRHEDDFLLWLGVFLILFPLALFLLAGRMYQSTPAIKEKLTATVTAEGLDFKGDSYSGNYKWTAVLKVVETSSWFLIYYSPGAAVPLKKANMDVQKFRAIVRSAPGVVRQLKKV